MLLSSSTSASDVHSTTMNAYRKHTRRNSTNHTRPSDRSQLPTHTRKRETNGSFRMGHVLRSDVCVMCACSWGKCVFVMSFSHSQPTHHVLFKFTVISLGSHMPESWHNRGVRSKHTNSRLLFYSELQISGSSHLSLIHI